MRPATAILAVLLTSVQVGAYELPFTATDRETGLAWQSTARNRLFELVAAQTPRHSLDKRPLDFKTEASEDREAYTLYRASFCGNDGQRYKCLWTVPKGRGRFPAMLCLHGHNASAEMVFDPKTPFRGFADRLARSGFCVLAPSLPHCQYAAVMLWDLIRCVDILSGQAQVDPQRIGAMGLSMGGEWTMWVAACDQRVKAAVVSGWMCTTEGILAVPNCSCWRLPGLENLMDICELHLLIAPRPVLFESATGDPHFPIEHVREGFARIRAGYRLFGNEDACVHDIFSGRHELHGEIAYPFLDRILGGHADGANRSLEPLHHRGVLCDTTDVIFLPEPAWRASG